LRILTRLILISIPQWSAINYLALPLLTDKLGGTFIIISHYYSKNKKNKIELKRKTEKFRREWKEIEGIGDVLLYAVSITTVMNLKTFDGVVINFRDTFETSE
jgi:hypothetical protein